MLSYNGLIRTALHHQWGYSVVLVFVGKRTTGEFMSADLPGQFLGPLVPKLATKLSLEQLSYIKISKAICL